MSDKHNNSDPIERFFRQKADDYDIQYNKEDWLKLEARLDQVERQHANRRRRRVAAAAVILLFAILAYFTYEQQQKINQLSEQLSNSENVTNLPEIIQDERTPENSPESDQNSSIVQSDIKPETISEPPIATSDEEADSESVNETNNSSGETVITEDNRQNSLTNLTESSLVVTKANASPGFDGRSPAISAIKPIKIESSPNEVDTKPQAFSSTFGSSEGLMAQRKMPRFSFGVLIGPDISTVGSISSFADPGHKFGFSLEYNITQNFAISIGAQRANVQYRANGSEYTLPDGYLPYGTAPGKITAQCILIDIPLSLKYNFLHFSKSRMYATGGLSSYIMLDEDYRFYYGNNQSGLPDRWHEQTGTRHWMSNTTVSIGYEFDLRRNISIRAEPFLKIPLKEVGWGNVDLYSMGSFISLNYKW
jgi:hypothetical protein